jgi:hypothetical protein
MPGSVLLISKIANSQLFVKLFVPMFHRGVNDPQR